MASAIIAMEPGTRDIHVPVVGAIECTPTLTKTALKPQQNAANMAKCIPSIGRSKVLFF